MVAEYEYGSVTDAVVTALTIVLNRDEAELAQILTDQLAD